MKLFRNRYHTTNNLPFYNKTNNNNDVKENTTKPHSVTITQNTDLTITKKKLLLFKLQKAKTITKSS